MNTWKNSNMLNESEENYESFKDYCKNYILDNIDNYEGQDVYACDLGSLITEAPNADGSLTYSTYKAKQYIKEWFDDAGAYWEYANSEFGGVRNNPFDNPEAFMVEMVIEGVNSILSQCDTIDGNWDDVIVLDKDTIEDISSQVKEFDSDLF